MPQRKTEDLHTSARGLDMRPVEEIGAVLLSGQLDALRAVSGATAEIARGGQLMAQTVRAGQQLVYAAAGSSGLMAMADACELAGTFGLPPERTRILMAGGIPTSSAMPGDTEDDAQEAQNAAAIIGKGDAVILLSASGRTPYPLTIAAIARDRGAHVICIANNPDTPLLELADVAICLPTPPEVISGSTRMGAGTAQKAALNMMSTIMGVALGHVHDGMMVNLYADNDKLRDRAARMVADIASVPHADAIEALAKAEGRVKPAVLLAMGAPNLTLAENLLTKADGRLRAAMAALHSHA
ncbi:N-acetylmuramic acid 6-phosphate etherase [Nioella aestuarii]|uniref:N-acetylmuramic acid 6-phosphate etherase n=1 Tax=Nioella aestuarii TaxID=1662864 RepID=UPI003D7F817A